MNTAHIVIIGGGFGGLNVARQLRNAPVQITLIDGQNYHMLVFVNWAWHYIFYENQIRLITRE